MQGGVSLYANLITKAEAGGPALVRGLATDIANYTPRESRGEHPPPEECHSTHTFGYPWGCRSRAAISCAAVAAVAGRPNARAACMHHARA
jgi:hypothetical protein